MIMMMENHHRRFELYYAMAKTTIGEIVKGRVGSELLRKFPKISFIVDSKV
ncbi:MAG: hypothetical protein QXH24_03350 [Candidatus Bathyarchaeia archaeon]